MGDKPAPRFKLGDRVYLQRGVHPPTLYSEYVGFKREPKKIMIRGLVQTCDFSHGYSDGSRPVHGTEALKYITSYDGGMEDEDNLFASLEEFQERRGDEIREWQEKQRIAAKEKRFKEYQAAKKLVSEFEGQIFEAAATQAAG